jgi:hypothetical protein
MPSTGIFVILTARAAYLKKIAELRFPGSPIERLFCFRTHVKNRQTSVRRAKANEARR